MRSPVIALSILATAVLSPSVTNAAPAYYDQSHAPSMPHHAGGGGAGGGSGGDSGGGYLAARSLPGLGFVNEIISRNNPGETRTPSIWTAQPKKYWKKAYDALTRRADDSQTTGGNAHSGSSGDVNGGSVENPDTTLNQGMPTVMNMNSNNAGGGGQSGTGCATSGKNSDTGSGGNASSGNSGKAVGGSVKGSPSGMVNVGSNNAGTAGQSSTGCATGGDSSSSA